MMGSTKLITSCVVVTFTLIAVLMEHSASGSTPCECKKKEISMTYLKIVEDLIEKLKENILSGKNDDNNERQIKPVDCSEVLRSGHNKSGVYTLWPMNRIIDGSVDVYCDMDTDGGGWTVIQRRGDYGRAEDYFFKGWESYKKGFGDIKEDFWLGNDVIYALTNQKHYSIRFDLGDSKGNKSYALYDSFWIEPEVTQYRLHVSDYRGDAGDCMNNYNNQKFTTKDRDNDVWKDGNCANKCKGAWWYKRCHVSNLNGLYLKGRTSNTGVTWDRWRGFESLYTTEMKIRPKYFLNSTFSQVIHSCENILTF